VGLNVSRALTWATSSTNSAKPDNAELLLLPLINKKLLVKGNDNSSVYSVSEPGEPGEPGGLAVCAWRPHLSEVLDPARKVPLSMVLAALRFIRSADRLLKEKSTRGIVSQLKELHDKQKDSMQAKNFPQLGFLVEAHIRARMLYPRKIYCLAGSAALAVHAWTMGIPVTFTIGVQKYPFYAHSWVQYKNVVANDSPEVARKLASILTIGRFKEGC